MDTFTHIETADVERIAVLRALFLGDLLCATPALRALEQAFPRAEVTLIGLPWAATLVERLPYLDRFVAFPGYPGIREVAYDQERTAAFFTDMRAQRFDLAFQMHGDGRSTNGFVAQLGAARTIGFARPGDTRLDIWAAYAPEEHETLRWLRSLALPIWCVALAAAIRPHWSITTAPPMSLSQRHGTSRLASRRSRQWPVRAR